MVMRSFKIVQLIMPVKHSIVNKTVAKIKNEFGDKLKIKIQKDKIIVEGELLGDYRVHDKILKLVRG